MKKLVFALVIPLFLVNQLHSQTTETLTNSTIIKMTKANLSDELIIDEINNSKVNFNLSIDSIKFLSNENVSYRVIQAMKTANDMQTSTVTKDNTTHINPVEPKESALTEKETPSQTKTIRAEKFISNTSESLEQGKTYILKKDYSLTADFLMNFPEGSILRLVGSNAKLIKSWEVVQPLDGSSAIIDSKLYTYFKQDHLWLLQPTLETPR